MSTTKLTKKDFRSDQDVRWCPGCGDYAILSAVQSTFAELGMDKDKTVVVSGIGCSSRFPYYMDTYGFHTIHGRAPAVATGIKLANPELDVWLVTGDGDALSIGGNHIIHTLRRNVGIKVMLFNNRIYGLTKGQYSPTSLPGTVTKSSPMGSIDNAFNPIALALGANATFVARSVDRFAKHLKATLLAAAAHKGTAFIEILQNCLIFNDGAWDHVTEREVRDEKVIDLRPNKPLIYGKNMDKGIKMHDLELHPMEIGGRSGTDDVITWRPGNPNPSLPFMAANIAERSDMPYPIGIFRNVETPAFEDAVHHQIDEAVERLGSGTLQDLIHAGDTWQV